MTNFLLNSGNIHDIRVPVPGTSAREFEETETGKKKKGEDKSINWNLQVQLIKNTRLFKIWNEPWKAFIEGAVLGKP